MNSWPITQTAALGRPPFSWFSRRVISIVAHSCCACHQISGTTNAAANATPAANQPLNSSRRPPLSKAPTTTANAKKPAW